MSEHDHLPPNVRDFLDRLAEIVADNVIKDAAKGGTSDVPRRNGDPAGECD